MFSTISGVKVTWDGKFFCFTKHSLIHSFFSNSSGMKNLGFSKSWCAPISLKLNWSCSSSSASPPPKKNFYARPTYLSLLHIQPIGAKLFFGALEQLHGSFSDIGAHQDFQKSKFFMPELLLKELCTDHSWFIIRR